MPRPAPEAPRSATSLLRQHGKTYAMVGLALGLPLFVLAAMGLARSSLDPSVEGASRAPAAAATAAAVSPTGAIVDPPAVAAEVPALEPYASRLPLVTLTRTSIFLGDAYLVGAAGARPADKFRAPSELDVPVLRSALEGLPPLLDADGVTIPGVRLLVGEDVSYRAFVEVLYTVGQSGRSSYCHLLARGRGGVAPSAIAWKPGGFRHGSRDVLAVAILVGPEGLAMRTDEGPVGPGCVAGTAGVTLPGLARPSLGAEAMACAERLRVARSPAADDPVVTITARPETPVWPIYELLAAFSLAQTHPAGPPSGPQLAFPVATPVEAWQDEPRADREKRARDLAQRAALNRLEDGLGKLFAPDAGAAGPPRSPHSRGAPAKRR